MKDILLIAEIIFFETAKKSFNFPIMNAIRNSFWLSHQNFSTFAEITPLESGFTETNKKYMAQIIIVERDFLQNQLHVGCEFKLGTYPLEIARGKILELKEI
jgi:hypothetical protein